jgi:hypothetical protein
MSLFELLTDGYVLRALGFAGTTLNALVSRLALFGSLGDKPCILLTGMVPETVNPGLIVEAKYPWNGNFLGTGHAVVAAGTVEVSHLFEADEMLDNTSFFLF